MKGIVSLPEATLLKAEAEVEPDRAVDSDLYGLQDRRPVDADFLDAVCNGVVVIDKNFLIINQNYISKANMGHLTGKLCYEALENRDSPCERCPLKVPVEGEFETLMRCAGKSFSLYEAQIYPPDRDGNVVEVYPDMIDREILVKNLYLYQEELDLLNNVVENIRNAIMDDVPGGE